MQSFPLSTMERMTYCWVIIASCQLISSMAVWYTEQVLLFLFLQIT